MWSSRPRAERLYRSLTLRLSLTFGLLGFVVIGAVVFATYTSVRHAIHAQVDRELTTTAKVLLHRLEEDHEPPSKELLDVGEHLSLRILDRAGGVRLATPGMERRAPAERFPTTSTGWAWGETPEAVGAPLRLLAVPCEEGALQLARDTSGEQWLLRRLRVALLWAFVLAPGLAAVAGHYLVRLGLRPLGTVARVLEDLRPETLGTRIDAVLLPTELLPLAGAVNRALARLESAFGRLSELNSELAHELRTPVHGLRLEAEQLLSRGGLPAQAEEGLAGILETLDHLGSVIEQMLFLSRFEDPSQGVAKVDLEPSHLLESAVAPFVSLAEEREVGFRWEVHGHPRLRGDAVLLRRALHNLLANALRHAPRGSLVTLRARQEGAEALLEVEDEGEGIPEEMVAQIGRRFLRHDASRSDRTGGTGLGLAIVRGIARAHGGSLEVGRPGKPGTVMQIKLP